MSSIYIYLFILISDEVNFVLIKSYNQAPTCDLRSSPDQDSCTHFICRYWAQDDHKIFKQVQLTFLTYIIV